MIKYLSLFSGIGAFEKAMQNLKIPYELVGYCEIDKHAARSYSLIHKVPETKNFGDITKIDETKLPNDIDFISYGFPCQDISICGKQKGFQDEDGNKTRNHNHKVVISKRFWKTYTLYFILPLFVCIHYQKNIFFQKVGIDIC